MKNINVVGDLIVDALQAKYYQIDGKDQSELHYSFRIKFNTRGGMVQQLVRLYPNKVQFEDLFHYDNNPLSGGHNTLPIEFMSIYNAILSIYVMETGNIPETDFILY